MDITSLIIYAVSLAIAFWAGIHYAQVRFLFNISRDPEKMMAMLAQIKAINDSEELGMGEDAIEVKTEQVDNVVYAYNKLDGTFLAQASSIHEVMIEAARRNPGKNFWHPEMTADRQTTC